MVNVVSVHNVRLATKFARDLRLNGVESDAEAIVEPRNGAVYYPFTHRLMMRIPRGRAKNLSLNVAKRMRGFGYSLTKKRFATVGGRRVLVGGVFVLKTRTGRFGLGGPVREITKTKNLGRRALVSLGYHPACSWLDRLTD